MSDSQKWLLLIATAAVGLLLYLLAPILTPFVAGAILAYIGDPLADRLEARGLSRTGSVVSVFVGLSLLFLLLSLFLVPLLQNQLSLLVHSLPGYIDWLQQRAVPWLQKRLGGYAPALDLAALKGYIHTHWQAAGGVAAGLLGVLSRSGVTVVGWLANLLLIPVVTFYLLRDWDRLMARLRALLPRRVEPVVVQLARSSDEVLGAFLRGQLMVMLALGVIYATGLWLAGLDLALLLGMVAGLVSFVPYLGFIVGIIAAGISAVFQFHDLLHLVYVAMVFGVGQAAEGFLLTPLLVGEKIGLHPVAVIFAVLAGGQLFGFFGVLVALPVAAVVAVLLRYVHERYLHSGLYGGES